MGFPSPVVSRNPTPMANTPALASKRSVSVDRRRSVAARPLIPDFDPKNGGVSAATKLLVTSTRSLSVSFQGEAFSLPISKTKVAPPSPNLSSVEGCKVADQHRWPARHRLMNPLLRSMDCSSSVEESSTLSGSGNAVRSLQNSMIDERRSSLGGRASLDLGHSELSNVAQQSPYGNSEFKNVALVPKGKWPSWNFASAKFWQETNSRLRRLQDPGSPLSTSPGSKLIVPPKLKKYSGNNSIMSSPRTMSSPIRGGVRAASPSKLMTPVGTSPSRGYSPSRIRNAVSTINNNFTGHALGS
ncbi:hypothetical protein SASPL_132020 [Salvia splendens]|uniref:Uncharacterized protein n=1 Tax=Salvia splendens TaxID=180675 RepID=A0A8X8ZKT9_SALSN|nr:hypothetical protein SASPL_132020 [Salvia splendens]